MQGLSRRELTLLALAVGLTPALAAHAQPGNYPPRAWVKHPLMARFWTRRNLPKDVSGVAPPNKLKFTLIEEQRVGAEWVTAAFVTGNAAWREYGWKMLDIGLTLIAPDGSGLGGFHSTSLFLEALGRAFLFDPAGATPERLKTFDRALNWQMSPAAEAVGIPGNKSFTHRRYFLANAFGQGAIILHNDRYRGRALAWAREGISLQQPNGLNPEKGGLDVSYQDAGCMCAVRYLAVCDDAGVAAGLRHMLVAAIALDLSRLSPEGVMDETGSTRIGHEQYFGTVKSMNYYEMFQTLVYSAQALPNPGLLKPATLVARNNSWLPDGWPRPT